MLRVFQVLLIAFFILFFFCLLLSMLAYRITETHNPSAKVITKIEVSARSAQITHTNTYMISNNREQIEVHNYKVVCLM